MARKTFVIAVWLAAASFGVIAFQCATYAFYRYWPPVSFGFLWQTLFGDELQTAGPDWAGAILRWVGDVPVTLAGILAAYAFFFVSDSLRRR